MPGVASSYRDGGGALQDRSVTTVSGLDIARQIPVDESDVPILNRSQQATFIVNGVGYGGYATPEDLLTLTGSASKIVRLLSARLLVHETTGTLRQVRFLRRSTANSGGTFTNPTPTTFDTTNAAATATVHLYTAAPTPGTLLGELGRQSVTTLVPTSVPGQFTFASIGGARIDSSDQFVQPVTLRGTSQVFAINWLGAALPAGFAAQWELIWTEADT